VGYCQGLILKIKSPTGIELGMYFYVLDQLNRRGIIIFMRMVERLNG